jgi:hypothetical protein
MPAHRPHKFIGFFKLIDAMKRPGCPVCLRIIDETHHAIESFLYESVNDVGLRKQIRKDGGFCPRHCWQLATFGDALGGAILFDDVLQSLLPTIGNLPRHPYHPPPVCLFCRSERQTLEMTLAELADQADDPELRAAWEGPAMLCLPHLSHLCQRMMRQPAARDRLIQRHLEKYQQLTGQMKRIIELQSYDHRDEPSGPEQDAWRRAIEVLVGQAALQEAGRKKN